MTRGTRTKARVTPLSLIISIPLFIFAVLFKHNIYALFLQAAFLLLSMLLFALSPRELRWKRLLPLIPLLLFVFLFNAFRGGGEILLRLGPIMLMRQGVNRGLYYAAFILELWIMSGLLTSFSEQELLSTLYTIGRPFREKGKDPGGDGGVALMLYYVLKIFHSTYVELRQFFVRGSGPLSRRTLLFVYSVFKHADSVYEKSDSVDPKTIRLRISDYLFVVLQVIFMLTAFILHALIEN